MNVESIDNIYWLRMDLRVHDNPAFYHAVSNGSTLAVFCLPLKQWQQHHMSPHQQALIKQQLLDVELSLRALGVPLLVLSVDDFDHTHSALLALAQKYNAKNIYFNYEYALNERVLTDNVTKAFQSLQLGVYAYHDQCLIPPGEICNKQGQPYKVFTAFKKAYMSELSSQMRPLYGLPAVQSSLAIESDVTALQHITHDLLPPWQAGEQHALDSMADFCEQQLVDYKKDRDVPSIDGTSRLSASLAVGILSVRQCWQMANNIKLQSAQHDGIDTWVSELVWRDFYRHLLHFYPSLCKHKAFKSSTEKLPWKKDQDLFDAWCQGKTGYPLVDAAMRQLNQTGWMHNRLRMVTAMFLTKHLFIDWRWGEQYFMENLIDGDFASNNGGWQWSASTGVDAVPYFRIFNPIRQSERFDSNGTFIRQYVPELSSLDNKQIHMPSPAVARHLNYFEPIVEHKQAVSQTKQWFKQLDSSTTLSQESLI